MSELGLGEKAFEDNFTGRSDEVKPSLIFSDSAMKIAKGVFGKTPYKDSHFNSVVNAHLRVPNIQHELLNRNIRSENMFKLYEREKRFAPLFSFKKSILSHLGDLRIAERPLILATADVQ